MYKKNLVFAAACLGLLLFGIGLITLGTVAADLKAKFNLDEISAGTLFSIMPFGILAGSLIFGPVCDRYGYKVILILSCIGMCLGFEGIAFAASVSFLKICIFIFGFSGGIINGATNAVVADISKDEKAANLNLLGVSFGIGALGMPFVLATLRSRFSYETILAAVGFFTLAIAVFYVFLQFPKSKQSQGFALAKSNKLFRDGLLIAIAFFLFCQSSFEAIINNWTTTFLTSKLNVPDSRALYALSLYVVGMTAMRLLAGTALKKLPGMKLMWISFGFLAAGTTLLKLSTSWLMAVAGLILLGAGLAVGFPVMLGIAGSRYAGQSGTAFSFVLVVALTGNMLVNYMMGLIAKRFGIQHLTTVAFAELVIMILLSIYIFRDRK